MELEGKNPVMVKKYLIFAALAVQKMHGSGGYGKGIANANEKRFRLPEEARQREIFDPLREGQRETSRFLCVHQGKPTRP
jgi:hypothetical protein